jgi:hypothetical protein
MRPLRAVAVAVVMGVVVAQGAPEPWRVLRAMEVDGLAAFDRDAIAVRLAFDPVSIDSLQRALDDEAAAQLAERVRELHRRGGYRRAEARGAVVDGVVRITLTAGPRYRCGTVACSGNVALTEQAIREALRNGGRDAVWKEGEFARADDRLAKRIEAAVQAEYRATGRYGAKVVVDVVPDDGAESLAARIRCEDEGRRVVIRGHWLVGEPDDEQRDAVLQSLQPELGRVASTGALSILRRMLGATGRYLKVEFELDDSSPAELDPLVIRVTPRPGSRPLGTTALRNAQRLQDAIDRVIARLHEGDSVTIETELTEAATWGRFRVLPGAVVGHLSRDGVIVELERLAWGDRAASAAAFEFDSTGLGVVLAGQTGVWHFRQRVGVQAQLTSTFAATGEASLRWGLGFSLQPADGLAVSIHPATAGHLLSLADEVQDDDGLLIVRFDATTARIRTDGSRVEVTGAGRKLAFALTPKASVEHRRATLRSGEGAPPIYGATLLLRVAGEALSAHLGQAPDPRVASLLRGVMATAIAPIRDGGRGEPAVDTPALVDGPPSGERIFEAFLMLPAVRRDVTGRLVELSGAFSSQLAGSLRGANQGFQAIAANPAYGPLSLGLVAAAQRELRRRGLQERFAALAAARWTFDGFYADAADLGANFPATHVLPLRIGAAWRTQPDLKDLLGELPAGEAGDLLAWRKGVEHLWNAGGGDLLRELLLGK